MSPALDLDAPEAVEDMLIYGQGMSDFLVEKKLGAPTLHEAPAPGDFQFWAYERGVKTWIPLHTALLSASWSDSIDEAAVSAQISLLNSPGYLQNTKGVDIGQRRLTELVGRGSTIRMFYVPPTRDIKPDDLLVDLVVWSKTTGSWDAPTLELQCYDRLIYLKESNTTVLYDTSTKKKGWTAEDITRDVCRRFNIPVGNLPKATFHNKYFYAEETTLYEIILRAWSVERRETGVKYLIRMRKGKLWVTIKKNRPKDMVWEFRGAEDGGTLLSSSYSESLTNLVTSVQVYGVDKDDSDGSGDGRTMQAKATANNPKLVAKYGLIHKTFQEGNYPKARMQKAADRYLEKHQFGEKTATMSAIGIPSLLSGDPIKIADAQSRLDDVYYCSSVEHSISATSGYTMSAELSTIDVFPKPAGGLNRDDLKPPDLPSTGLADPTGAKNTTKWPKHVWNELVLACAALGKIGINKGWANDNALAELISHESSFNPAADNPTSTAYGLFQFMDFTWGPVATWAITQGVQPVLPDWAKMGGGGKSVPGHESSSPIYWQCYAGLCYVRQRYKTPTAAWNFWQARVPIDGKDVGNWY